MEKAKRGMLVVTVGSLLIAVISIVFMIAAIHKSADKESITPDIEYTQRINELTQENERLQEQIYGLQTMTGTTMPQTEIEALIERVLFLWFDYNVDNNDAWEYRTSHRDELYEICLNNTLVDTLFYTPGTLHELQSSIEEGQKYRPEGYMHSFSVWDIHVFPSFSYSESGIMNASAVAIWTHGVKEAVDDGSDVARHSIAIFDLVFLDDEWKLQDVSYYNSLKEFGQ